MTLGISVLMFVDCLSLKIFRRKADGCLLLIGEGDNKT